MYWSVTQEFRGLAHNLAEYRGRELCHDFLLPILASFRLAQDSLMAGVGQFMEKHAYDIPWPDPILRPPYA